MDFLRAVLFAPLTTHRDRPSWGDDDDDVSRDHLPPGAPDDDAAPPPPPLFQHERLIAALSVAFCRWTVTSSSYKTYGSSVKSREGPDEPLIVRAFFSLLLGTLAYLGCDYEFICSVQVFSYCVPALLPLCRRRITSGKFGDALIAAAALPLSAVASLLLCRTLSPGSSSLSLPALLSAVTPPSLSEPFGRLTHHLFPVSELARAHDLVSKFAEPESLRRQLNHLLFVTFNVQVGMGYLGIGFLKEEQKRRNVLVRMEIEEDNDEDETKNTAGGCGGGGDGSGAAAAAQNGTTKADTAAGDAKEVEKNKKKKQDDIQSRRLESSRAFRASAAPFIFCTVLPYMFQIIFFGNMNMFSYACVRDDIHRMVREGPFVGGGHRLVAMSGGEWASPDAYATSVETVVSTSYDIFNRKFFSFPKLALLPGVILRQPGLLIQIFPFIFLSDLVKARLVSTLTDAVERLDKEARDVQETRRRVEAFDVKNAELLHRSGPSAAEFTARRWEDLTEEIQNKRIASELLKRTRGFYGWLQRNFVFAALIDCALARLIAAGRIASAEIFVFSRAIEDAVDLLLMRSRAESELATLMTEVGKLGELADLWERSGERRLLPCTLPDGAGSMTAERKAKGSVRIRNLLYSRGTALVRVDDTELLPGIYAVTGANGSGKSTLFRVLMSCSTNAEAVDLPESIQLETPRLEETAPDAHAAVHVNGTCDAPYDGCEVSVEEAKSGYVDPAKEDVEDEEVTEVPILSIEMPGSDAVEISQNFYWPLHARPIDWIYQRYLDDVPDEKRKEEMVSRVARELMSLVFVPSTPDDQRVCAEGMGDQCSNEDESSPTSAPTAPPLSKATAQLESELTEIKEDWFSDLSGGQKSKVELVRKVFLRDFCPRVLLIDETMAPLDPASKSLVMGKVRDFCRDSVVLVIYHTDVGRTDGEVEEDKGVECVPSVGFFDHNLHVENRVLVRRAVC